MNFIWVRIMRFNLKQFIVFALMVFVAPVPHIRAEEAVFTGLSSLIDEALAQNPQIEAARKKWEAARFRVTQASALPDPTAGYSYMGNMVETRTGPQENMYEFEQEIPFPGKLIHKRKMARADVDLAEAQLKAAEREVKAKLTQAYYDLYALQKTLELTEQIHILLVASEDKTRADYAGMRGSLAEHVNVQNMVSQLLERLLILRQQKETLMAYIKTLVNRDIDLSWEGFDRPAVPVIGVTLEGLLLKLEENNTQVLEAMAMAKREKHAHSLAKYENAPDFSIGFRYVEVGAGTTSHPDDGQDAWMIPIKVTLPIWQNRIGATIKEAKSNLKASESQLQDAENQVEFELKNAYFQFQSQQQIAELYQLTYIPQARIVFESEQAGYESGQVGLTALIDSKRRYFEAQISYYQALAGALKTFSEIERLIGEDIQPMNNGPKMVKETNSEVNNESQ